MINRYGKAMIALLLIFSLNVNAQTDSVPRNTDSLHLSVLQQYRQKLAEVEKQRVADSLRKAELEIQLLKVKSSNTLKKDELLKQLKQIDENEKNRVAANRVRVDSLRKSVHGYPVIGAGKDTLYFVYTKLGASTPSERASNTSQKIKKLYRNDFLKVDSIKILPAENSFDIVYDDLILASVSESDMLFYNEAMPELAANLSETIKESIIKAKADNSLFKLIGRIGLVLLVVSVAWLVFWLIGKGHVKFLVFVRSKKDQWLKDLSYKDYTFLTAEQELQVILFLSKVLRWFIYALLLYFTLPIIFSIFPFSRTWADTLIQLIWSPFKSVISSVWAYIPNLFTILVIYFVMRYVVRFVRYIFGEIEAEKLKIAGFHADWAMPTYSIVKFLLYAFMFVLIFPYLPGSDSNVFKGVSVFIGILFSLGSSSAIANMIAGMVITYMRPFKIGDRIKIGEVTGDVIEKTLLVTRIRTVKNEIITIPNSSVLTGNTTNYTSEANERGLIVHTTVTIGYDVPWKDMHDALIEAALRTDMLLDEPKPFVLQTSLDDFYVSYQVNAFTREASKQAIVYSNLHQNIQDVCNERGIEILSPHFRAARDGNKSTIPSSYLPGDYIAPGFNVNVNEEKKEG